jgi:hypothetical protein
MKLRALFLFAALLLAGPFSASAQTTPPPTCSMMTVPSTVVQGGSFTLKWTSTNARAGVIPGPGLGNVAPVGQRNLIPVRSTRLVGTFTGPGGTARCEAIIVVLGPNGTPITVTDYEEGSLILNEPEDLDDPDNDLNQPGTINQPQNLTQPQSLGPIPTTNAGSRPQGTDIRLTNDKPKGLVPCTGTDCQACKLVELGQNIINFLVGLSIPLAAVMFAYAGFLYFSSSVIDKIEKAKKIFTSVLIGFAIVVGGYLIVETVLHTILADDYFTSWNKVQCVTSGRLDGKTIADLLASIPILNNLNTNVQVNPAPISSGANGCRSDVACDPNLNGGGSNGTFNQYDGNLQNAIDGYKDADTTMGPNCTGGTGGQCACAWAVNNVLNTAGEPSLDGNSVQGMLDALNDGRGDYVADPSAAQKGDIVVWKEGNISHVGFCYNDGCSQTISNGSRSGRFDNVHGLVDRGVTGRIYHLK